MMRTKAPKRVEPSTIAASSSSFGTPAMKPRSVQTQNGSTKATYVTITPESLSTCPTRLSAMKSGMISATSGTICTAKITTTKARRP